MVIHPINNGNPEKNVSDTAPFWWIDDHPPVWVNATYIQLLTVAYVGSGPAFPENPMHASAADHMNSVIQARTQMPHIAWHSPNITWCWKGLIYLIL